MATAVLDVPEKVQTKSQWIVSPRVDFLWFTVGGAASAYIFWALWRFTHVPLILLVAIWAVVFDETHGFATISRTYLDAEERQRRGRWLWGSLAFFLAIGPDPDSCFTWAIGWSSPPCSGATTTSSSSIMAS